MIIMTCGACDGTIPVTKGQWRNQDFAPCPNCEDGGADLIHARAHSDNPEE